MLPLTIPNPSNVATQQETEKLEITLFYLFFILSLQWAFTEHCVFNGIKSRVTTKLDLRRLALVHGSLRKYKVNQPKFAVQ